MEEVKVVIERGMEEEEKMTAELFDKMVEELEDKLAEKLFEPFFKSRFFAEFKERSALMEMNVVVSAM